MAKSELELYKNIKVRRIELGMTQTELADRAGYADKSMISRIEAGLIDLPQTKIVEIAAALRTTPSELMGPVERIEDELLALIAKATPDEIEQTTNYLRMLIYARDMKDGEL